MIKNTKVFFLAILSVNALFAIVGDWVSYGSQLTLKDLHINDNTIYMSSHGGIVKFDIDADSFSGVNHGAEHIDIRTYYINSDGSEWFSYASGINGISYRNSDENGDYFDFDFTDANAFTGNNENVLVAYVKDLAPVIAHFVKNNNRYIFQDTYNQFPGSPDQINDIELVGDSLYLATDIGLIKGWLNHANLKPESAWESVALDSSSGIGLLFSDGDSLYYVNEDRDVYCYYKGDEIKVFEGTYAGVTFASNEHLFYASEKAIYDLTEQRQVYSTGGTITGFATEGNDKVWLSEEDNGLKSLSLSNGLIKQYLPNTMLHTKAHSLAMTSDQKVIVCGMEGVSILEDTGWHNLVFRRGEESVGNTPVENAFYADTLDIAYRIAGETTVYDAMVSSNNNLFYSVSHVSIFPFTGQDPHTEGPGALLKVNLGNLAEYTVYDTTDGVLDGTQGVAAGSSHYLIMRGLTEDKYGNVWVINAHTLAGETLLKFRPDGEIQRFSVNDSGEKLQILAREMIFDKYGNLWIANEARQADEPRTTGGITVFDPGSGTWALITTADGLASNDVYSIDEDPQTGNMWVATAAGVQMVRTQSSFTSGADFTMNLPIDGLSNMVPVKIRIDARGNKWVLTQSQGVQIYLTNNRWFDDGKGLTTDNSGLLDNVVYDLVFDDARGYAYLLTASGLSRYEIAWADERTDMSKVIVFPQPFQPGVDPYIAIDGIADQSQVRISTLDGRVLARFDADADENKEKQLIWDGKLPNGDYIPRGVYLAFITNIDGLKKTVKFAVK